MRGFDRHTARPSIDLDFMIRVLVIGSVIGLRSERGRCQEMNLDLSHRRFCGLGRKDKEPDHSNLPKLRRGRFRDKGFALDASQWAAPRKGQHFCPYSENSMIEMDHGIIMGVEAMLSRSDCIWNEGIAWDS